ncbi:MAG: GreA/GreB family elongation factor [Prosthecobacter sp.]|jgi:transcription elongation GreA/GreB family factor|nr:GreA/GreB family elongation factor [Prosthecobacter sp.]
MEKAAIIDAFIRLLGSELQCLTRAAQDAFAAATDPDSRAENKYDTRTLEASYVARGQAQRVAELREALSTFEAMSKLPLAEGRPVGQGSLVSLDTAEGAMHCLIAPCAGGTEVCHDGDEVFVITPHSPLGQRLMGRRVGERFALPSGALARLSWHQ